MLDTVIFENDYCDLFMPYEQHGILMKSHTISPPKPKVHRFTLDGMDGDLDATEWTGEVRFEPRTVEISFRDMTANQYEALVQFLLGRNMKIIFSEWGDTYFYGRCESLETATQHRVTDLDLSFTCQPYRLYRFPTSVERTIDGEDTINLRAARMTAKPTINVSADMTVEYDGVTYELETGDNTPNIVITDRPQTMTVTGTGTIKVIWRDGVL